MSSGKSLGEVERLKRTYALYREDPDVARRWSSANAGNRAILAERRSLTRHLLGAQGLMPLSHCDVLDVGCGHGGELAFLQELGADPSRLYGIDLLQERIEVARAAHPGYHLQCGNAESLPYEDDFFDLVLLFTVLSSVLDEGMARDLCTEVDRVLRPGGAVLWYDFRYRNPLNPATKPVGRGALRGYFPGYEEELKRLTLLPPLARRLGHFTPILYPILAQVPPLRTHYLACLRKTHSGEKKQT